MNDKLRGKDFCRGCDSMSLFSVLDFGDLPIANELLKNETDTSSVFPLHLRICESCGLGQVEEVVLPERLFSDYRYLSSVSASFLEHAKDFVERSVMDLELTASDWVLEIASNDGYLLRNFLDFGIPALGVEPATNVAKIANSKGIETIDRFFGTSLASEILAERGFPKLIIANNVLAHVPDMADFISGLRILCGETTVISIENPSLMNLLEKNQFDTIYHEHYSYLTVTSVNFIASRFGLELFNVEEIGTHGGSNRYWLNLPTPRSKVYELVSQLSQSEINRGLLNKLEWEKFTINSSISIDSFRNWLRQKNSDGAIVCGYGAAAKASTLINAAHIEPSWIKVIADEGSEKQNRYMPSHSIPIVSPSTLLEICPTDVVIFPWNIASEISQKVSQLLGGEVRIWIAIPSMEKLN
jgi:hypothetical protein